MHLSVYNRIPVCFQPKEVQHRGTSGEDSPIYHIAENRIDRGLLLVLGMLVRISLRTPNTWGFPVAFLEVLPKAGEVAVSDTLRDPSDR